MEAKKGYSRAVRRLFLLLSVALFLLSAGCIIKERCYLDKDCPGQKVCNQDTGKCEYQCVDDEECALEEKCELNRCVAAVECTTCSFPNAAHECLHGTCVMGACDPGWHDINGVEEDGCEYPCTTSAGGEEVCDDADNDCDGEIDEGFDLSSDPDNCGGCGVACTAGPHADPVCASGTCAYTCHEGWYDNNRLSEDGCEDSQCMPTGEVCDGYDNDCDCTADTNGDTIRCGPGDEGVDEGFDKTLPGTCGPWCVACRYGHAEALCVDGACRMGVCQEGWHDADGRDVNGCEYECTLTAGGVEVCDGIDNDCDRLVDEDGVCGLVCPDGMVAVGTAFCMDRYEAARIDATADDAGSDESAIKTEAGVMPWMVNPLDSAAMSAFGAACEGRGRRLCTANEFYLACTGPGPTPTTYVYGDTFDPETCNCVDTWCDDYCEDNGIPPAECNTDMNCGYRCGTSSSSTTCFRPMPTGQFPGCTNAYGTFDLNGNMWEAVLSETDPRGFEIRGGAFNCATPNVRLQCTFNASWNALFAGFRCCLTPP